MRDSDSRIPKLCLRRLLAGQDLASTPTRYHRAVRRRYFGAISKADKRTVVGSPRLRARCTHLRCATTTGTLCFGALYSDWQCRYSASRRAEPPRAVATPRTSYTLEHGREEALGNGNPDPGRGSLQSELTLLRSTSSSLRETKKEEAGRVS
ncbi:hypothetical protein IE81DRAFT_29629 [Ceraceosorus guamensis]|uniref:Uncharacterized protein n=1 Tax=Ceraceosorus guamensis TaxID=1522189 RepID=A0A316W8D1_9BASI|nr:hypothetical protein IE81DRAFT_29629 [Ceraceosorus guamensis]PWN44303.1 hypothetical protein IE81DRAFT_29629 [Ceraceosorus guamensis]